MKLLAVTTSVEFMPATSEMPTTNRVCIRVPDNVDPDSFLINWLQSMHTMICIEDAKGPKFGQWFEIGLAPRSVPKEVLQTRRRRSRKPQAPVVQMVLAMPEIELPESLTEEDKLYLRLRMKGLSNETIAQQLKVKQETICQRRLRIRRRLGLEVDIDTFLLGLMYFERHPVSIPEKST